MKGALVIRYGDAETAKAIADGMEAGSRMSKTELEVVKSEMQKMREAQAPLGVRVVRDRKYFKRKIARAKRKYGYVSYGNVVTNALWGVYGLAIEVVGSWLDNIFE